MKIIIDMSMDEANGILNAVTQISCVFGRIMKHDDIQKVRDTFTETEEFTMPFMGGTATRKGTEYTFDFEEKAVGLGLKAGIKGAALIAPMIMAAKGLLGMIKSLRPNLSEIAKDYREAFADPMHYDVGTYWNESIGVVTTFLIGENRYGTGYVQIEYLDGTKFFSKKTIQDIVMADRNKGDNSKFITYYATGMSDLNKAQEALGECTHNVRADVEGPKKAAEAKAAEQPNAASVEIDDQWM